MKNKIKPWNRGEYLTHSTSSTKEKSPGPVYHVKPDERSEYSRVVIAARHRQIEDINTAPYYDVPTSFGRPPNSMSNSAGSSRAGSRQSNRRNSTSSIDMQNDMNNSPSYDKSYNQIKIKGKHEPVMNDLGSPGPKYNPEYKTISPKNAKSKIGTRKMQQFTDDSGGYSYFGTTFKGPKYTIQSRIDDDICIV